MAFLFWATAYIIIHILTYLLVVHVLAKGHWKNKDNVQLISKQTIQPGGIKTTHEGWLEDIDKHFK